MDNYIVTFVQTDSYGETDYGTMSDTKMPRQWVFSSLEPAKGLFLHMYEEMEEESFDDEELENIDKGYAYANFLGARALFLRKQEVLSEAPTDDREIWKGIDC